MSAAITARPPNSFVYAAPCSRHPGGSPRRTIRLHKPADRSTGEAPRRVDIPHSTAKNNPALPTDARASEALRASLGAGAALALSEDTARSMPAAVPASISAMPSAISTVGAAEEAALRPTAFTAQTAVHGPRDGASWAPLMSNGSSVESYSAMCQGRYAGVLAYWRTGVLAYGVLAYWRSMSDGHSFARCLDV